MEETWQSHCPCLCSSSILILELLLELLKPFPIFLHAIPFIIILHRTWVKLLLLAERIKSPNNLYFVIAHQWAFWPLLQTLCSQVLCGLCSCGWSLTLITCPISSLTCPISSKCPSLSQSLSLPLTFPLLFMYKAGLSPGHLYSGIQTSPEQVWRAPEESRPRFHLHAGLRNLLGNELILREERAKSHKYVPIVSQPVSKEGVTLITA